MTYQYTFDRTTWGTFSYRKTAYAVIQGALTLLRSEIQAWNDKAIQHGAVSAPYQEEIADLDGMINYGANELATGQDPLTFSGVSVGNVRYIKAGLVLMVARRESEIHEKARAGWPGGVIASLRTRLGDIEHISGDFDVRPAEILDEIMVGLGRVPSANAPEWDLFISHASEDKETFVRPLAEKLTAQGLRVWFDESTLRVGDSLRRSIDSGLSRSQFGVVVISRSFLAKEWPQRELDGLTAREVDGSKVILPVWHDIDFEGVRRFSPVLADRYAVKSSLGVDRVVEELLQAIRA
jgi:hypothetical protein